SKSDKKRIGNLVTITQLFLTILSLCIIIKQVGKKFKIRIRNYRYKALCIRKTLFAGKGVYPLFLGEQGVLSIG
ncbi:MAG: hypothetical protein ACI4M3_01235, partial [Acutalibacteraceae bacterium]